MAHQKDALDHALAAALTAVNERNLVLRRLADEARSRHDASAARRFTAQAQAAEAHRKQMQQLLDQIEDALDDTVEDPSTGEGMIPPPARLRG